MNLFTIQKSFAISAGAGSGKTYTLSRRYINAYLGFDFFESGEGIEDLKAADLDEIVTITFTEAAALEMKERIFKLMGSILSFDRMGKKERDYASIGKALRNLDGEQRTYVKERLEKAIERMDDAVVTTIHGFCLDLLKRHADHLKVDAGMEVIDDTDKEALFEESLYETLNDPSLEEEVFGITKHLSFYKSRSVIEKYIYNKKFREAFGHFVHDEAYLKEIIGKLHPVTVDEALIEAADREIPGIKQWFERYRNFGAESFNGFVEETIGEKLDFRTKKHKEAYANVRELRETLQEETFCFNEEKERLFEDVLRRLLKILSILKSRYDEKLRERDMIDFDRILELADELLRRLKIRYKYVMVDEFQDTNALQYEIVAKIAEGTNLFVVGDEKQSIYAFQGAEIDIFKRVIEERFGGRFETMATNYRSDREILAFANRLFSKIFTSPLLPIKNDFSASPQELRPHSEEEGTVDLLVTVPETEEGNRDVGGLEADAIARYVRSIVDDERYPDLREKIQKGEKAIAILFDAKSKMGEFKEALNRYGIDCKVSGGENFWKKDEVKDLFFVLKAISLDGCWVSRREKDEKRYYTLGALKSDILHWKESDIREYFENLDRFDVRDILPFSIENLKPSEAARRIFVESGAYLSYNNYEQTLANVEKLISQIVALENEFGYDLPKILDVLERNVFHAEKEEAFFESETAGSIELCSIHSTKGLAYPMVILAQASKSLAQQANTEGIKFEKFRDLKDNERVLVGFKIGEYKPLSYRVLADVARMKHIAEKRRLLYVALTRAEHHVTVSMAFKREGEENLKYSDDSYTAMMLDALETEAEKLLYLDTIPADGVDIHILRNDELPQPQVEKPERTYEIVRPLEPLMFERTLFTPSEPPSVASLVGTAVHEIIELYHDDIDHAPVSKIVDRYALWDHTEIIRKKIEAFKNSPTYEALRKAKEAHFEFNFEIEGRTGRIDCLYRDEEGRWVVVDFKTGEERDHSEQLEGYREALEAIGITPVETRVEYL